MSTRHELEPVILPPFHSQDAYSYHDKICGEVDLGERVSTIANCYASLQRVAMWMAESGDLWQDELEEYLKRVMKLYKLFGKMVGNAITPGPEMAASYVATLAANGLYKGCLEYRPGCDVVAIMGVKTSLARN